MRTDKGPDKPKQRLFSLVATPEGKDDERALRETTARFLPGSRCPQSAMATKPRECISLSGSLPCGVEIFDTLSMTRVEREKEKEIEREDESEKEGKGSE